ncbi:aldehyde dehydrogenase (NADP(+)) [Mucilaginibacter sp. L3T2-6]|uniref:aldehyde dehydrogenase (NADP(+)) n=1 Tax=Mucilaginibacter sp. L3T2-6 TaxID=3062491 RepID=UPI00267716A0|nr:aldehyde dehydrogenase (NADP(+)) [Mucilaginibacter sp. L3T2-6]MDO3640539.1 aldehyde dehydrogenase (NADP(+)) [Mucilaginibacter sp. L3T2-6]MDV6213122.1 aldehyde dehydrogenase (NADP(+)) [Mucilaginibacter sp. L3T2-6]
METRNLIGNSYRPGNGNKFKAVDPAHGVDLPGEFYAASVAEANNAMDLADKAFTAYRNIGPKKKAAFLRSIADEIIAIGDALLERASAESGLPVPRLQGERARTTNQLKMFADLLEEGSWVEAIIDTAIPDRQPLPRLDIRKMMVPLGPAVVFGASNFPLAFSVAGGDTAAALAAGCPVVVKAHPAHPGTSALVAEAIRKAAEATAMPEGVFSILYDDGYAIGETLVKHPKTKIVTFTGSLKGGMALVKISRERDEPIPVFAEMGSINPLILLPGALKNRPAELAKLAGPITNNAGQFCTQPGLLITINGEGLAEFKTALAGEIKEIMSSTMLTPGICANFNKLAGNMLAEDAVKIIAKSEKVDTTKNNQGVPLVTEISAAEFLLDEKFKEEVFGPYSMLIVAENRGELEQVVNSLHGQLTASIYADGDELAGYKNVTDKLADIAGRVILNGPPTGVEVGNAIQHGGPFPATSDSRFTSVGTSSIKRFVRPVCWQNWSEDLLPDELKTSNPLNIWRLFNNEWKK